MCRDFFLTKKRHLTVPGIKYALWPSGSVFRIHKSKVFCMRGFKFIDGEY